MKRWLIGRIPNTYTGSILRGLLLGGGSDNSYLFIDNRDHPDYKRNLRISNTVNNNGSGSRGGPVIVLVPLG